MGVQVILRTLLKAMLAPFVASFALVLPATTAAFSRVGETPPHCVRYFALEEIKPDVLRKAVADLGTPEDPARIVTGPSTATCRPKVSFIALDVRDDLSGKDVARGLKKGCKSAEELVWTTFTGVDKPLPSILGVSAQDCVIGMASDMRWFESAGEAKHFYFVPGKLDAKSIAKQFQNLFQPFNAGDIGNVATESLTFALPEGADAEAVKRATKAIGKLDGVRKVDAASGSIAVEAELDGLHASACAREKAVTGPRFHPKPILDALAKEKIAPAK